MHWNEERPIIAAGVDREGWRIFESQYGTLRYHHSGAWEFTCERYNDFGNTLEKDSDGWNFIESEEGNPVVRLWTHGGEFFVGMSLIG